MTKKAGQNMDAIAVAERCEAAVIDCGEGLPNLAEQFREAAATIRSLHRIIAQTECPHVMTMKVTQQMIDSGFEDRPVGKYCMTCGTRLEKPKTKPDESKAEDGGEDNATESS